MDIKDLYKDKWIGRTIKDIFLMVDSDGRIELIHFEFGDGAIFVGSTNGLNIGEEWVS